MGRCDQLTIEDMLARVPAGASELFGRRIMHDGTERFLSVHQIGSITVPDGAVFRDDELARFHHFTDLDLFGWFWSRELIDAARAAGIKGVRTLSCATTSGFTVDRLQ